MSAVPLSHPRWCDPAYCTISEAGPQGAHHSASHVVPADPPVETVAELHLVSTMRGIAPQILLMLDLDLDHDLRPETAACFGYAADSDPDSTTYPMTLHQARDLHAALGKLLAAFDELPKT